MKKIYFLLAYFTMPVSVFSVVIWNKINAPLTVCEDGIALAILNPGDQHEIEIKYNVQIKIGRIMGIFALPECNTRDYCVVIKGPRSVMGQFFKSTTEDRVYRWLKKNE